MLYTLIYIHYAGRNACRVKRHSARSIFHELTKCLVVAARVTLQEVQRIDCHGVSARGRLLTAPTRLFSAGAVL